MTDYLRTAQLLGEFKSDISFTLKPLDIGKNGLKITDSIFNIEEYAPIISTFLGGKGKVKLIPIDYNIEFSRKSISFTILI